MAGPGGTHEHASLERGGDGKDADENACRGQSVELSVGEGRDGLLSVESVVGVYVWGIRREGAIEGRDERGDRAVCAPW